MNEKTLSLARIDVRLLPHEYRAHPLEIGVSMTQRPEIEGHLVGGRYEIVRPLASGGMATVYVARHHLTRQEVALKIVAAVFARDEAGVARFLREVSVASRIGHDGVVKVFDAGFDETLGSPYLAMELLDGRSLAQVLAEREVHQADAMRYVLAMLEPLAAAHDAGVVHRDLKPENVFVARGPGGREVVKLLDFGVARDLRGSRTATMEGTALGTVYYMAPEQALDARAVTATADVYAIGVILYQVLCGIFPFDGSTPHAVLIRANREVAVPVAERATGIDPRLASLVDRCLAKDPNERPGDAASLRGLLAPLLADPAIDAWLAARAVNPATFLSGPPPEPTSSFDDPFAAPAKQRTSLTPEVSFGGSVEIAAQPSIAPQPAAALAPPPPSRRAALWIAAVLLPLAITVAFVATRSPHTNAPAPAPVIAAPAPAPAPVIAAPAPVIAAPAPAPAPVIAAPAPAPVIAAQPMRRSRDRSPSNDLPLAQPAPAPAPAPMVAEPAPTPAPVIAAPVIAAPAPVAAPAVAHPTPPRPVPTAPPPEHAQDQQPSAPPFVSF